MTGAVGARPLETGLLYFAVYVVATAVSIPGAVILTLAAGAMFGLGCALLLPHPGQKTADAVAPQEERPALPRPKHRQALPGGTRVAAWRPRRS